MAIQSLLIGSDNLLQVSGLYDTVEGDYVNDATVQVTLVDLAGSEVTGETWPLSLSYVSSSNGVYRATLADTLTLKRYGSYTAQITADGGAGKKRTWYMPVRAFQGN